MSETPTEVQGVEYDDRTPQWTLILTTRTGGISTLKDLDAKTARRIYQDYRPETRPVEYINGTIEDIINSTVFMWNNVVHDSDIHEVRVYGPEGAELDPWRDVGPRIFDVEMFIRQNRETEDMLSRYQGLGRCEPVYYESLPWWKKLGTWLGLVSPPTSFHVD